MNTSLIINQVLNLFMPVVVGFIIIRIGIVEKGFVKGVSAFLYNITLPCTVALALRGGAGDISVSDALALFAVSSAIVLVSKLLAELVIRYTKPKEEMRGVIRFALCFSNFSFMGYPVAEALMGERGLVMATVYSLPLFLMVQSVGVAFILDKSGGRNLRKLLLNPPMLGVVAGLVLFLTKIAFPRGIERTIESFGAMTTPLAMLLVGMTLAGVSVKKTLASPLCYLVALLRLVVIPIGVYAVLSLIGVRSDVRDVATIISMMPIASNIIIVLSGRGLDSTHAASAVLVALVLGVVTIPLMTTLLL